MNGFKLYAVCASFYGSARAGFRVGDADMLPGAKIVTIFTGGVYGPLFLPVYIINDINRGFIYSNGLKYSDYGYPDKDKCVTDILFH